MSVSAMLSLTCWLDDDDGQHVWQRHSCVNGTTIESMLPYPMWRANTAKRTVEPSIYCLACGLHAFGSLEEKR